MAEEGYPKWLKLADHIGPILVRSKKEEQKTQADWDNSPAAKAHEKEVSGFPEIEEPEVKKPPAETPVKPK